MLPTIWPGRRKGWPRRLRAAEEEVGFYYLTGHGVDQELIDRVFAAATRFHDQPLDAKIALKQNVNNVGYMPVRSSVTRANALDGKKRKPNVVEAFFIKRDLAEDHPDVVAGKRFRGANQWPDDLPGFRETCMAYCGAMEALCLRMLPVYATALDLPTDYFTAAFTEPMITRRLSLYPPLSDYESDEFGVAPHTDTSFLTMLAQNEVPGLSVRRPDGRWIDAPVIPGAFVVNSGDMLKRWTNDRFLSTPHRVRSAGGRDRYAIPFFFDCHVDNIVSCVPSCVTPDNPAKYPPISYHDFMVNFTQANYSHVRVAAKGL